MRDLHRRWTHAAGLLAVLVAAAPLAAQPPDTDTDTDAETEAEAEAEAAATAAADDRLLREEPWVQTGYGLRLRPPRGTKVVEQTANGSLVQFIEPERYVISVFVVEPDEPVDLRRAVNGAHDQIGGVYPNNAILRVHPQPDAPGLSTGWVFLSIERGAKGDLVIGRAMIKLGRLTMLTVQLECPAEHFPVARAAINAVVRTVSFEDPGQLLRRRATMLAHGDLWRTQLTGEVLAAAIEPMRWYRLVKGGKDIGYRRVQTSSDPAVLQQLGLEPPGVVVQEQTRLYTTGGLYDTAAQYYVSSRGDTGIWSIATTWRTQRAPGVAGDEVSWRETGIRDRGDRAAPVLTVVRDEPPEFDMSDELVDPRRKPAPAWQPGNPEALPIEQVREPLVWVQPKRAFLPQVHAALMPHLLWRSPRPTPPKTPEQAAALEKRGLPVIDADAAWPPRELAFYAYHQKTAKLAVWTLRIEPQDDGTTLVRSRATPERPEHVIVYDTQKQLVEVRLPGGLTMVPSTPEEMKRVWRIR